MPLPEGATFAGFTIVRLLGSGSMGEVYSAKHPRLPRLQALRILPADVSADAGFRARFHREADLAASLWHPHIVGVHDRGESHGRLWISMSYVEGSNGAELLRQQPGGLPRGEVVEIISAIAEALDYAHERGLLHRDVKPANILLTQPNAVPRRALLADLGLTRRVTDFSGLSAVNVTYTAPEQLQDMPVDGRADQYSLAATAYHLMCGSPPFSHPSPAVVISRHVSAPPPKIGAMRRELADLDTAISRALAKDPAARFPRCQDFAGALRAGGPERPAPPAPPRQPPPSAVGAGPFPAPPPGPPGWAPAPYGGPWVPAGAPPPGWGSPPPRRRIGRWWALGGAAAAVVVAMVVAVALLRPDSGGHPVTSTTPTPSRAPAASAASAEDTGPVSIITKDPTCATWTPISQQWLDGSPIEHWNDAAGKTPLLVPSTDWTPEQRQAMLATANATRIAVAKTAPLAKTTPHRVMRELYEQFIAYGRAFADSMTNYLPRGSSLGAAMESTLNALISICSTVSDGTAAARSVLVTTPAAPPHVAPPQDPARAQRFVTATDITTCGQLQSVSHKFDNDPAVKDWDNSDKDISASQWSPEQRSLNDAVAPLMLSLADDIEHTVQSSNNPPMQDFATLSAQYQRAFAKALPIYVVDDLELGSVARYVRNVLTDACSAVGA